MSKAYLAALAAFAFATLLVVGSPARSAHADHAEPGQLFLEKVCVGVDGEFAFDIEVSVIGDPVALAALDAQIEAVNDEFSLELTRNDVVDIIESEFSQELFLLCNDDAVEVFFEGSVDLGAPVAFDLETILDGITVGGLEVFGFDEMGLSLQLEIIELDDDQLGPDIDVTFSDDCAGGIINLIDVLETGVHCTITNTQPTLADLDIQIEKICVNGAEGIFPLNLAIAVDLTDAPDELLDILVEAGLLDDTLPLELNIDDVLGSIECGETSTYTVGEPLRMLLAAALIFDLDFTVTLEEVAVPAGVEVTYGGLDCDADGLVLDVSDTGFFSDMVTLSAIEIDSPTDLLIFLGSITTTGPEMACEVTNTFGLSTLTVNKDCVPANSAATFEIEVRNSDGDIVGSETLACDDTLVVEDLEPGEYNLRELSASDGLENYTTFIVCTDGVSAEEVAVEVDVLGATECWIINYDNREVTPPATPPTVPQIINIINENNNNTNTNTNTQNQSNNQDQTNNQTNNQNNQQSTGDTNVDVNTGGATGTGGSGGNATGGSGGSASGGSVGNIKPPNTGSAGLAQSSTGLGVSSAMMALATLVGTLSLVAVKTARIGGK